MDFPITLEAIR